MSLLAFSALAAAGWIYAAAAFQDYGKVWAVDTCTSLSILCAHPHFILYGAIVSTVIVYAVNTIKGA
jgi:hypothetical protein